MSNDAEKRRDIISQAESWNSGTEPSRHCIGSCSGAIIRAIFYATDRICEAIRESKANEET